MASFDGSRSARDAVVAEASGCGGRFPSGTGIARQLRSMASGRLLRCFQIVWLGVGAGLSEACTVSALAERESSIAVNQCSSNDDCSQGSCREGLCVGSESQLANLLLELTPSANAGPIAGASFLVASPVTSNQVLELELRMISVVGSITPGQPGCTARFRENPSGQTLPVALDQSIPANLSFSPSILPKLPTLAGRLISAQTEPSANSSDPLTPASHRFIAELPPGIYDIHARPFEIATEASGESRCRLAPQLIRGLCIEASRGSAELRLTLPPPVHLDLVVRVEEQQLSGWIADVIDGVTGLQISRPVALSLPSTDQGISVYHIGLDYQPVIEHQDCRQQPLGRADEVVRLSPPADQVAPVLLFERRALELFSKGHARIDGVPRMPNRVTVEGHVFDSSNGSPTSATLTLVASKLSLVPKGVLAAFSRRVKASADGRFEADILPGSYQVHVEPDRSFELGKVPLASARVTWEVPESPRHQAGRAVELSGSLLLLGNAVLPGSREGARGASVVAEAPVRLRTQGHLTRALDGVFLPPYATDAVIADHGGAFGIYADRGIFDLSVRPPNGSGLAWLVLPNLDLSDSEGTRKLPRLELPLPVAVPVSASIPGDSRSSEGSAPRLEGARLRAFVPLDAEGDLASPGAEDSYILVAESRLNALGETQVLVPASLQLEAFE